MSVPVVDVVTAVPKRALRLAGAVRRRALDNALAASRALTAAITERQALAPQDDSFPGALVRLTRGECLALLRSRQVGRLAYVARAGIPDIVPVNYVMDGATVIFRSGHGPKLQAADRGDVVALEVDQLDDQSESGLSVVVVGHARRLRTAEVDRLPALPRSWAAGARTHLVRISPDRIEGRRLV